MKLPLFLALLAFAAPTLAAKPKTPKKAVAPAKSERTWKALVDHMISKGADYSIKAPTSRTLGFDSDKVITKGLYLKDTDSKDGREHSFSVVVDSSEKGLAPKEIVLARIKVMQSDGEKQIEANRLRLSLEGKPIRGIAANGIVGKVQQRSLEPDSKEAQDFFTAEKDFWLKDVDLEKLVK